MGQENKKACRKWYKTIFKNFPIELFHGKRPCLSRPRTISKTLLWNDYLASDRIQVSFKNRNADGCSTWGGRGDIRRPLKGKKKKKMETKMLSPNPCAAISSEFFLIDWGWFYKSMLHRYRLKIFYIYIKALKRYFNREKK